jgi:hypothetical protein
MSPPLCEDPNTRSGRRLPASVDISHRPRADRFIQAGGRSLHLRRVRTFVPICPVWVRSASLPGARVAPDRRALGRGSACERRDLLSRPMARPSSAPWLPTAAFPTRVDGLWSSAGWAFEPKEGRVAVPGESWLMAESSSGAARPPTSPVVPRARLAPSQTCRACRRSSTVRWSCFARRPAPRPHPWPPGRKALGRVGRTHEPCHLLTFDLRELGQALHGPQRGARGLGRPPCGLRWALRSRVAAFEGARRGDKLCPLVESRRLAADR